MTNPTDTNQASEDELRAAVLTEFKQVHKLAPADYTENCTNVVMSIIRTEKLKLLAEVRERVVGEDVEYIKWYTDITGEQDYYYTVKRPMAVKHQNELRGKQRAELTRLEAEL